MQGNNQATATQDRGQEVQKMVDWYQEHPGQPYDGKEATPQAVAIIPNHINQINVLLGKVPYALSFDPTNEVMLSPKDDGKRAFSGAYEKLFQASGITVEGQPTSEQIASIKKIVALEEVLRENYPLLHTTLTMRMSTDEKFWLQEGAKLSQQDPELAKRYADYWKVVNQVQSETAKFVANGMPEPEKFEAQMKQWNAQLTGLAVQELALHKPVVRQMGVGNDPMTGQIMQAGQMPTVSHNELITKLQQADQKAQSSSTLQAALGAAPQREVALQDKQGPAQNNADVVRMLTNDVAAKKMQPLQDQLTVFKEQHKDLDPVARRKAVGQGMMKSMGILTKEEAEAKAKAEGKQEPSKASEKTRNAAPDPKVEEKASENKATGSRKFFQNLFAKLTPSSRAATPKVEGAKDADITKMASKKGESKKEEPSKSAKPREQEKQKTKGQEQGAPKQSQETTKDIKATPKQEEPSKSGKPKNQEKSNEGTEKTQNRAQKIGQDIKDKAKAIVQKIKAELESANHKDSKPKSLSMHPRNTNYNKDQTTGRHF